MKPLGLKGNVHNALCLSTGAAPRMPLHCALLQAFNALGVESQNKYQHNQFLHPMFCSLSLKYWQ
jgi:hypothetical protein